MALIGMHIVVFAMIFVTILMMTLLHFLFMRVRDALRLKIHFADFRSTGHVDTRNFGPARMKMIGNSQNVGTHALPLRKVHFHITKSWNPKS